jgi:hypothetical protein
MESYLVSTSAISFGDYRAKLTKAKAAKDSLGINLYGVSVSNDGVTDYSADKWHAMIAAAHIDGLDAVGWGVANFAAATSSSPYREIPEKYRRVALIAEDAAAADQATETVTRTVYSQDHGATLGTLEINYTSLSCNLGTLIP